MKTAWLGLGSNLGDRWARLAEALRCLSVDPAISVTAGSSIYESKPVGVLAQPDFLNLVVQIETAYSPLSLLSACLDIEAYLGRERHERWGPRIIDLDILAFDQLVWSDERLVLPHPRMHERSFVLTPLAEITPELKINGVSARELAARVGVAGLRCIAAWKELAEVAGIPARPAHAS